MLGAEFVDRDFESHVGDKIERNEKIIWLKWNEMVEPVLTRKLCVTK